MEKQAVLFSDLDLTAPVPASGSTAAAQTLNAEIAALWGLPLGQRVQVTLRDHSIDGIDGLLELARLPDLPLDARAALQLRIGAESFTSRQIINWTVRS